MSDKLMSIVDIGNNHEFHNNISILQNDNQNQNENTISDLGSAEFNKFAQTNNNEFLAQEKTFRSRAISGAFNPNTMNKN